MNKLMRSKSFIIKLIFSLFFVCISMSLPAQSDRILKAMKHGDALRESYRFSEAMETYESAMSMFSDSLMTADDSLLKMQVSDRMLMAENGLSMMDFVFIPEVVARHRFSLEDFFLYYPLHDDSWYSVPCQLDSASHSLSKAVYVPEGQDIIYWSAEDQDGIRNIYRSEFQDTVWTAPALLNESMTSVSDEIYPMLSPDGKKMYFSSSGLYGVGGQDLYVSEWDEDTKEWSSPVNMGFPYSSPADDFLLADTEDGRYTIFASNRDCSGDSVWVYVLAYDDMPVRQTVSDVDELRRLALLEPRDKIDDSDDVAADIPENVDTRKYMSKMAEVRSLRDSISLIGTMMEEARVRREEEVVLEYEARMPALQDSLEKASAMLQEIELEFLFSGVVIDPDKLLAEADREIAGQSADYVFSKMRPGGRLALNMLTPEPKFDYSFKILEEGQFAEDNTIPKGIVYQIQMFSLSAKATVRQLKGLSPVFESLSSKGKYIYRVGLFNTYNDVLDHLNAVKKVGFRNAFIVAYHDGKEVTVAKAKVIESELKEKNTLYEVRINTGKAELDMAIADGIRQQAAGKDIARSVGDDGTNTYVVGPFADRNTAEKLAGFVRAMGVSDAGSFKINSK